MKKTLVSIMLLAVFVSTAFGSAFSPNVLRFSAPQNIQYDFDGKNLNIPVTVSGAPVNALFFVFTKDKGESISAVTNGYLGWHYVNKIDTCLYVSGVNSFDIGSNVISWDGKDENGLPVTAGEYTYYLWGYDGVSQKTLVSNYILMDHSTHSTFVTHDENGDAKAQPIFYKANGTMKLVIGSDPMDSLLIETTSSIGNRQFLLNPDDHSTFFVHTLIQERGMVSKYSWVPNGESSLVSDWGTDDGISYFHSADTDLRKGGGMAIVDDKIIVGLYDRDSLDGNAVLCYLDKDDGELMETIDLTDRWYHLEDREEAGAQSGGGPGQVFARNKMVFLSTFNACYREMIDPSIEDTDEFVVWGNGNGDYTGDHNFEETSSKPWTCFDFNVSPYAYTTHADEHLFSSFGAYDMGAVSFGLIAPDGTGLGYFAFAGENANFKQGILYCDYGSAYDGVYTDNASAAAGEAKPVTVPGVFFLGHDSIKGVIAKSPVAVEEAPAAFSVSQNSPNPFNPATAISFSIAEAGNVSIDVFNVAGQRVGTIANEFMDAGSHSVSWNASEFSAGVYFYTVNAGDISKTMKMTLLK